MTAELLDDVLPEGWADGYGMLLATTEPEAASVEQLVGALGRLPAGPQAMDVLHELGRRALTEDQRLSVVQGWQGQLGWVAGQEAAAVASFAGPVPVTVRRPGDPVRLPEGWDPACGLDPEREYAVQTELREQGRVLELAAALACSKETAAAKLARCRDLAGVYAPVGAALRAGRIDPVRAWVLTSELSSAPNVDPGPLLEGLLDGAAGVAPGVLRARVRKALRAADPTWTTQRFAKARRHRRVELTTDAVDGLVLLSAWLPPVEALVVHRQLERAANAGPVDPADDRTRDERMADALVTAVLGSADGDQTHPQPPAIEVGVLVTLPTLLGLRDDPAELVGYGDIPAGVARALSEDAAWRRWVYDPVDGHLLDLGTTTYRPNAELDAYLRARDRYCRFPHSRRRAEKADLDHHQEHRPDGSGGATSADNLGALSRSVHRVKTFLTWTITPLGDGVIRWRTPLGREYLTRPHDYRPDSERDPTDPSDG